MRNWLLLSLVLVLLVSASAAFAVTVVVNGETLPSSPPAIVRNDRVLLPMRVIFESLGATVKWMATTQTASAVRGDTTISMSINQRTAYIGDRAVTLDVPPQLINGSTYMPVRFPAEAFGADVNWEDASQTVSINLPHPEPQPEPQPQPPTPPQPEPQPQPEAQPLAPAPPQPEPQPQGGRITGTVSAITASRLVLMVDSSLKVYNITASTVFLSRDYQASPRDVHIGDLATVEYDADGNVVTIDAKYDTVQGIVQAKTLDEIVLDSGTRPFRVRSPVVVTTESGGPERYDEIKIGDRVSLRVTPDTNAVYAITLQRNERAQIRIISDIAGPLLPGDTYRLRVTGTPGCQGSFSLGSWRRDIPLTESADQPGMYTGIFRVPELTTPRDEPIIVTLNTQDGRVMTSQSEGPLHFGTAPVPDESLTPRLISPIKDDQVGKEVVVEGRTAPNADLSIRITWRGTGQEVRREGGLVGQLHITADGSGYFRTDPINLTVSSDLAVENIGYTLTIFATDQRGNTSPTLTVGFTQ